MNKLQIQEALMESMNTLIGSKINSMNNVLTIEVFIESLIDESLHLYKAKYYDEIIEVYSSNDATYNVNDKVTVLVPEGDFTKDKFIIGYVPNIDSNVDNNPTEKVIYNHVFQIYENNEGYSLTSAEETETDNDFDNHSEIDDSIDKSQIFGDYINNTYSKVGISNVLGITATFNIDISAERGVVPGNHGIHFTIPVIKNNENTELTLGFTAYNEENANEKDELILGNVYNLIDSTQTVYFLLPDDTKYDISRNKNISVKYFCSGYTEGGKTDDIKITDIHIDIYERIDFSKITDKYYLHIVPSDVNYFGQYYYSGDKNLNAKLYIDGKLTPISDEWVYDWYIIDYSQEGGKRKLGNNSELKVSSNEVPYISTYGCTISKNNNGFPFTVTGELDLYRLNSIYNLTLTKNGSFTKRTDIEQFDIEGRCKKTLSFSTDVNFYWGYNNSVNLELNNVLKNSAIKVNNNEYAISEVLYSHYVDDGCTIFLTAYEGETYIGTKKMFLVLEESKNGKYSVIIHHEPALHKYNADGSSPYMQDTATQYVKNIYNIKDITFDIVENTEHGAYPISEEFYNKCQVTWILPNHDKSLMDFSQSIGTDYSLDENYDYILEKWGRSSIKYTIDGKYDLNKSSLSGNTIKLIVNINNEETYENYISTTFLKDGSGGTNGTPYSAEITWMDMPYEAIYKGSKYDSYAKLIVIKANGTYYFYDYKTEEIRLFDNIKNNPFKVNVYRNGFLQHESNYKVTYGIRGNLFSINKGVLSLKSGTTSADIYRNIVSAEIVYKDIESQAERTLHAFYPIDYCETSQDISIFTKQQPLMLPEIIEGFSEVVYNEQGFLPQKIDRKFKTTTTNLEFGVSKGTNLTVQSHSNLQIENNNISPKSELDLSLEKNDYVTAKFSISNDYSSLNGITDIQDQEGLRQYLSKINTIEKGIIDEKYSLFSKFWEMFYTLQNGKYTKTILFQNISDKKAILNNAATFDSCQQLLLSFLNNLGWTDSTNKDTNNYIIHTSQEDLSPSEYFYSIAQKFYINFNVENPVSINAYEIIKQHDFKANKFYVINQLEDKDVQLFAKKMVTEKCLSAKGEEELNKLITNSLNAKKKLEKIIQKYPNNQDDFLYQFIKIINDIIEKFKKEKEDKYENIYPLCTNWITTLTYIKEKYLYNVHDGLYEVFDKDFKYTSLLIKKYEDKENNIFYYIYDENNSYYKDIVRTITNKTVEASNKLFESWNQQNYNNTLFYYKPILCKRNVYGNVHINNWDGLNVQVGKDYMMTPYMAAGEKERETFKGIYLGKVSKANGNSNEDRIGLSAMGGYCSDKIGEGEVGETFFLDAATGALTIGTSGSGQINIDPNKYVQKKKPLEVGQTEQKYDYQRRAWIYSSNFFSHAQKDDSRFNIFNEEDDFWGKNTKDGIFKLYGDTDSTGLLIDLTTPRIQLKHKGQIIFNAGPEGAMISSITDKNSSLKDVSSIINIPLPPKYWESPPTAIVYTDPLGYNYKYLYKEANIDGKTVYVTINNLVSTDENEMYVNESQVYTFIDLKQTNPQIFYSSSINDPSDSDRNNIVYFKTISNLGLMAVTMKGVDETTKEGEYYISCLPKGEKITTYLLHTKDRFYYKPNISMILLYTEDMYKRYSDLRTDIQQFYISSQNNTYIDVEVYNKDRTEKISRLKSIVVNVGDYIYFENDTYYVSYNENYVKLATVPPDGNGWLTLPYLYCSESMIQDNKANGSGVALMSINPEDADNKEVISTFNVTSSNIKAQSSYDRHFDNSVIVGPAGISLGKYTFLKSSGGIYIGEPGEEWAIEHLSKSLTKEETEMFDFTPSKGLLTYNVQYTYETDKTGATTITKMNISDSSIAMADCGLKFGKYFHLDSIHNLLHIGFKDTRKELFDSKNKHWHFSWGDSGLNGGLIFSTSALIEKYCQKGSFDFTKYVEKIIKGYQNPENENYRDTIAITNKGVVLSPLFCLSKSSSAKGDFITMGDYAGCYLKLKNLDDEHTGFVCQFESGSGTFNISEKAYTSGDDIEYTKDMVFGTHGIRFGNTFKVYRKQDEAKGEFLGQIHDTNFYIIDTENGNELVTLKDYVARHGGGGNLPPAENATF